jgi:hypothetical protein
MNEKGDAFTGIAFFLLRVLNSSKASSKKSQQLSGLRA